MKILDRLPLGRDPQVLSFGGGSVDVNRNQIIVCISINDALKPFPALLGSRRGHSY